MVQLVLGRVRIEIKIFQTMVLIFGVFKRKRKKVGFKFLFIGFVDGSECVYLWLVFSVFQIRRVFGDFCIFVNVLQFVRSLDTYGGEDIYIDVFSVKWIV